MITNKIIKINIVDNLTSEYIENEFKKLNLDVLRWSITDIDDDFYTVNISVIEN